MTHDPWNQAPAHPELPPGALHVWIASLDGSEERCEALLDPGERARAARFRSEHLRRRFRIAHGFLREVLSGYLGSTPHFLIDGYGKPELAGTTDLRFNLSHSADVAVLAVTRGRRVGVDVEMHRPIPELASITSHYFTAEERALIGVSEPPFFTCWTRKEAYIKAVGRGLSIPLSSFDTSRSIPGWWLQDLPPITGGAGAIVLEGEAAPVCSYWRWSNQPAF